MMRKIGLALLLCVLLAALSGCAAPEIIPMATQQPANYGLTPPTNQPTNEPEYEGDPEAEEDIGEYTAEMTQIPVSSETYAFAGSTPLPLDPIDMPTPTPRPALAFSYQTYEATKLGLKFDGPAGWEVDDTAEDTYTITEPAGQQRDNYTAFMTLRKTPVNSQYNGNDLRKEVSDMLETIGATNFTLWEPTYSDERTLMDEAGIYANYSGTLVDGTRVRGRVHVTCIDKVLYSRHMSHPANYNTAYLQTHAKLRATLTLTK